MAETYPKMEKFSLHLKCPEFIMAASKCSIDSFPMAANFDSNLIAALQKKLLHNSKLKPSYREGNDEIRKIIQIYRKNLS